MALRSDYQEIVLTEARGTDDVRLFLDGDRNRWTKLATLVSHWDFARNWEFDTMLRYVSALPNPRVPAYTELDLRLAENRAQDALELRCKPADEAAP